MVILLKIATRLVGITPEEEKFTIELRYIRHCFFTGGNGGCVFYALSDNGCMSDSPEL